MNKKIEDLVDSIIKEDIKSCVKNAPINIQTYLANPTYMKSNNKDIEVSIFDRLLDDVQKKLLMDTSEVNFVNYKTDKEPETMDPYELNGGIMTKIITSENGGYALYAEIFNYEGTIGSIGMRFDSETNNMLEQKLTNETKEYINMYRPLEKIKNIEIINDTIDKLQFTINGKENKYYNVGYINGNFGINYTTNDGAYDNSYVHARSAITVEKSDIEALGLTPTEFTALINNPNANITINALYNDEVQLGLIDLNQYVCVEVTDNGKICAREENIAILNFIKRDIEDQMQYDILQAYKEELSSDNIAVFITDDKKPIIDKSVFVDEYESNIMIIYDSVNKQLSVELEGHSEDEHPNELVEFLQDKFGSNRYEDAYENKIIISSPVGMEFSETDIASIADRLNEIEEVGYQYDGLYGTQYINGYGYKDGEITFGTLQDNYDYGAYVNIEEIVFTESDVRKLGYEPKEFVALINKPEGSAITFKADYGHGVIDNNFENEETYQLNTYDSVRVMSDDWSTCLATRYNDERLMDAFNKVYEMKEKAIEMEEQNTDDILY